MNDPRLIITGAYIACGEMPDGGVFVSVQGVGLRRLTAPVRALVATAGDWRLLGMEGTLEAVETPSEATAIAFHRAGYALAVYTPVVVPPTGGGSGYGGDEVTYFPAPPDEWRFEIWKYSDAAWALAAAGVTTGGGAEWELIVDGEQLHVCQMGAGVAGRVFVRRATAMVELTGYQPSAARQRVGLGACANSSLAGRTGAAWWRGRWWTIRTMGGQPTVCVQESGVPWAIVPAGHGSEGAISVTAAAAGGGSVQFGGSFVDHYTGQQPVFGGVWGFWDNSRWQWADLGPTTYLERLTQGGTVAIEGVAETLGVRVWGVGESDGAARLWLLEHLAQGVLIYAREKDGVIGLQVSGTGDPNIDGWYYPDGDGHWVREGGGYEIILVDGQYLIIPVGGTAADAIYSTGGTGSHSDIVVIGGDDADGHYSYTGDDETGHGIWTQDDGEHQIIWDGEKWVLVDGDGTIIYVDGSGADPWDGIWTTPDGGTGPVVAGQMEETDEYLAPAGMVYEWIVENDSREVAYEARIKLDAAPEIWRAMRFLVRCDREDAAADDWRTYQVMHAGRAVELDTPGHFVRVAVFRPDGAEMPACQVETRRFRS